MFTYKIIDSANADDVKLKNEPFELYGRMIPSLKNGEWTYTEELFPKDKITSIRYPDENYDYETMKKDHAFVAAYDGKACIGLAVMADDMFGYMYLDDLKVNAAYRGNGVGRGIIAKALEAAGLRGYRGIYAIAQDDNLAACRFYLACGFEIGGFDNRIYRGTVQEDKANFMFYIDK